MKTGATLGCYDGGQHLRGRTVQPSCEQRGWIPDLSHVMELHPHVILLIFLMSFLNTMS